jgi:transposase
VLTLLPSVRVYVAAQPTDLRKSFDGLSAAVATRFGEDPLGGHLFVFRNRRGNQIRILFWDRTGYVIVAKKLAQGRFHLARALVEGATHVEIEAAELGLMLEGIDLTQAVRRKRWRLDPRDGERAQGDESACLSVPGAGATPRGR